MYRRDVDAVYRFIFGRTGNRADAEDICAQVFLRALPRLRADEHERAIRGYLYATARSLIADYWAERYSFSPFEDQDELDQDTATTNESRHVDQVAALLARLPDRERTVLELRFLRGYTIVETARAVDVTVANCKVIQYRALRRAADLDVPR